MSKSDIKQFIDFFHTASIAIRKEKPNFVRGKDGNLIKKALSKLSESQLEMLAVWFLSKKPKLRPSVGSMLSKKVLEELLKKLRDPHFWKELDDIYEKNFPRQISLADIKEDMRAFHENQIIGLL